MNFQQSSEKGSIFGIDKFCVLVFEISRFGSNTEINNCSLGQNFQAIYGILHFLLVITGFILHMIVTS